MEDKKIVDLFWMRSEQAITETATKYGKYCHSIACNILSNNRDAEEAVNDTYMGAITSYVKNNEASVSSSELLAYVSEYLTDAAIDRLFSEKAAMVSLQWLRDNGVSADFVGDEYNIYLTFSTDDMPVQILSISDTRGFRRTVRPIADAIELDPAVFVLRSRYTFDTSFMIYPFNFIMSYSTKR